MTSTPGAPSSRPAADDAARFLRREAMTARLLGVDFLPVRVGAPPGGDRRAEGPAAVEATGARGPGAPARPAPSGDKAARLAALRARHDAECPHCTRATAHSRTVFGEGSPDAELMFVGEAPGAEEDRTGVPFVGRAGQKLNEMIGAMGLRREDVYITNVLKARPPDNATPTPEEAANCGPCLAEQISIIQPRVIVALGAPATKFLLDTREGISSLRGRWHSYRGIPVMPTFHPAFLLRQYTPENRRKVWSDLQQAVARLKEPAAPPPTPTAGGA